MYEYVSEQNLFIIIFTIHFWDRLKLLNDKNFDIKDILRSGEKLGLSVTLKT